jgi:hypothetical protein
MEPRVSMVTPGVRTGWRQIVRAQMIKHLLILFLLSASQVSAGDIRKENIDISELQGALPEKWHIADVFQVQEPDGWKRSEGGSGIRITVAREPYSYDLKPEKAGGLSVFRPQFVICIMPNDFIGISANGEEFKNGKALPPKLIPRRAVSILSYAGSRGEAYVFLSTTTFSDWKEPGRIIKYIQQKGQP